jgi:hypothetical protein
MKSKLKKVTMKIYRIKTLIVLIALLGASIAMSSCSTSMYFAPDKLVSFMHYGYIIDKNGQKIDGLIELNAFGSIWMNQSTIGFTPQAAIDKAKAKNKTTIKSKWYESTELKGYGYNNKVFETKQIELSNGKKYRMLELISAEKKTYKFYDSNDRPSDPNKYNILREKPNGEFERLR